MEKIDLTHDQVSALNVLDYGQNVFLTGEAGTGKTELLNIFCSKVHNLGGSVITTASTGIAATNFIDGRTIHSVLKWHPNASAFDYNICKEAMEKASVIIIDEASMLNTDILKHISICYRFATHKPQLVFCGDFKQLPPVAKDKYSYALPVRYPFETIEWESFGLKTCYLQEVVRQPDPELVHNLHLAGIADPSCISYFLGNAQKTKIDGAIILCTRNKDADDMNKKNIALIPTSAKCYYANGDIDHANFVNSRVEKILTLKEGMRVMSLRNTSKYQNGSLGTILSLDDNNVTVRFDTGITCDIQRATYMLDSLKNGEDGVEIAQFPLRGGYAITIHKSQGQTFDAVNIMAPYCWAAGQLYVALSRVRNANMMHFLSGLNPKSLHADPRVLAYYNSIKCA